MADSLTNDLTLACGTTDRAGIVRVFLAETCDIASMTYGADHSITAITMSSTANVFYEFEAEADTKGLNATGSNENGTPAFENVVTFTIRGLDKTKLARLQELMEARKITSVIETPNSTGTYNQGFVVGWDKIRGKDAHLVPNADYKIEPTFNGANDVVVTLTGKGAEIVRELVGTIETNSSSTVNFGT